MTPQLALFLHISSSWVKIRLYTENQLPRLSRSGFKVYLGGGGGGWVGSTQLCGHTNFKLRIGLKLGFDNTGMIFSLNLPRVLKFYKQTFGTGKVGHLTQPTPQKI